MKKNMLQVGKYILFFSLFLLSYLFLPILAADETWSYGFAYNVASGLTPYLDFNMIVPPVFSFLFALFLFFYKGILMFHIAQALMMTVICYLLEKLVKQKYLFFVFLLLILSPMIYNLPTYNMLSFCFCLFLIYCEKEHYSDFLIGILLGLSFFTKQSVGTLTFLVGLFIAFSDKRRVSQRIFGFLVPTLFIFFYLVGSGSFFAFLDQCFFGMVEFSQNGSSSFFLLLFMLFVVGIFFQHYRKKSGEKCFLYAFAFYFVCFPLFDFTHFLIGLFSLMLVYFSYASFSFSKYLNLAFFLLIFFIPVIGATRLLLFGNHYPNHIENYQYRYLSSYEEHNILELSKYYQKHSSMELVILSSSAYIFKLTNHLPITKLDLINRGNWGWDGYHKIMREIAHKDFKKTLFLIHRDELSYDNQIDKEVLRQVIRHSSKVDSVLYFDVYQLKSLKNFEK